MNIKPAPKLEIRINEQDTGFIISRAAITGRGPQFGGSSEGEEYHAIETPEKVGELVIKLLKWQEA